MLTLCAIIKTQVMTILSDDIDDIQSDQRVFYEACSLQLR